MGTMTEEETKLIDASRKGDFDLVKTLIENGVNVNIQDECGFTPLMVAAYLGNLEIVKLLHNSGADLNIKTNVGQSTVLDRAISYGHLETVKYLYKNKAESAINYNIHITGNKDHDKIVEFLKDELKRYGLIVDQLDVTGTKDLIEILYSHNGTENE